MYQEQVIRILKLFRGGSMSYRMIFLSCAMMWSPLCAMQKKLQDYLKQRQWKKQSPAFMKAAKEGDLITLKAMLTGSIDVNITDDVFEGSALMCASSALEGAVNRGPAAAIRLLVTYGAHVNHVNTIGFSAIDAALYSQDQDSVCFLFKNSRNVHPLKKNRSPEKILEHHKKFQPDKAAFLAQCIEQVKSGESRTIAEMVLIDQGFPNVVTRTILPYIGPEETQKEREQTVQWLQSLLLAELVQADR